MAITLLIIFLPSSTMAQAVSSQEDSIPKIFKLHRPVFLLYNVLGFMGTAFHFELDANRLSHFSSSFCRFYHIFPDFQGYCIAQSCKVSCTRLSTVFTADCFNSDMISDCKSNFCGTKSWYISTSRALAIFESVLSLGQSRKPSMEFIVCSEISAFSASLNCDQPFCFLYFLRF